MFDISKNSFLKYILFGNLYFANGLQGALGIVILVVYFTELGISISITTMVAGLVSFPFTFKFIFGPITDYFIKYGKKPFAIGGGILAGVSLFPCAFIDPREALLPFSFFLFIGVIGIVILDVAADAWAIQSTKIHEHGKVNAAMFSSMFTGMAFGCVFLSYIAHYFGYQMVFIVTGCIILLTIIIPFLINEKIIITKRPKIAKLLISEFKKKNTILVAIFAMATAMNIGLILFIIPEYMMNVLHLNVTQIGFISSLYPIGVAIGAVTGGTLSDKLGRKKILFIFFIGTIIFATLLITAKNWQTMAILYPIIGFLQGGTIFSTIMALFMDITNPKIGATQFSILTSIGNFGNYGLAIVSGALVLTLGYTRFFLFTAWIVGPAILLLYFIKETKK